MQEEREYIHWGGQKCPWERNPARGASFLPLHFSQDLALVGGQQGTVVRHLLKHGAALELIAGFLKVISAKDEQKGS